MTYKLITQDQAEELFNAEMKGAFNEYKEGENYIMGVDTGLNEYACCVIRRSDRMVMYSNWSPYKDAFEREVARLVKYYHIPENLILREK